MTWVLVELNAFENLVVGWAYEFDSTWKCDQGIGSVTILEGLWCGEMSPSTAIGTRRFSTPTSHALRDRCLSSPTMCWELHIILFYFATIHTPLDVVGAKPKSMSHILEEWKSFFNLCKLEHECYVCQYQLLYRTKDLYLFALPNIHLLSWGTI